MHEDFVIVFVPLVFMKVSFVKAVLVTLASRFIVDSYLIHISCFSFADECCKVIKKQPHACISAYQCWERHQTRSLISDLQADFLP